MTPAIRREQPSPGVGARASVLLPLALRALTVAIALVMLIPLAFVAAYTIATGWETAYQLLVRPRVGELMFNTVRLVVVTVVTCGTIGTLGAWLTERTALPLSALWRVLLVAPLAVPSFVNGFAWVSLSSRLEGY